ncbi:MAG TPA: hypothetical protein VF748_00765 [Candidatus Acidoferrum sp.]
MSARIGNPVEIVAASAILGVSSGRVIPLNNQQWVLITSVVIVYVPTATVGNRVPVFDFTDASNVGIFRAVQGGSVTASSNTRFAMGAGIPTAVVTSPPVTTIALPDGLSLPPGSRLTVFDNANIDVNDSVTGSIVFSN